MNVDLVKKYLDCTLDKEKLPGLKYVCQKIQKNEPTYREVSIATGIPWYLIGAICERESSQNFNCYLHNGDPLFSSSGAPLKTIHVPKGKGPFQSWQGAAIDALGMHHDVQWTMDVMLDWAEKYNGLGYRHKGFPSPYLWSGTSEYKSGKYTSDGVFSATAIDKQPGVAAMFKFLGV